MKFLQNHPIPAADLIILYYEKTVFRGLVLVERKYPPKGFALPGGMMELGETIEQAGKREAKEETGLDIKLLRIIGVYSEPKRDKRFHSISIAFLARASGKLKAGDDAKGTIIVPLNKIPKLCFDHNRILKEHMREIRKELRKRQ